MIYMLKYIQESLREESVSFGVPPKEVPKKANLPFFLSFFPLFNQTNSEYRFQPTGSCTSE